VKSAKTVAYFHLAKLSSLQLTKPASQHSTSVCFKVPVCFSETRFEAYAHRVFNNFLEKYTVVSCVLETIASSDKPHAKDADNLL